MFLSLFSGTLGCLKDVRIHLNRDPEVKPVRQKLRPLAFHLREAISKETKKQIELGILERVTDDIGPKHCSHFEGQGGRDGKPSPVKAQTERSPEVQKQGKKNPLSNLDGRREPLLAQQFLQAKLFPTLDILKAFH